MRPAVLLIGKMGSGKTVVTLTAIYQQLRAERLTRVLVLATRNICETVWAQEAGKWRNLDSLSFACAIGSASTRKKAIDSGAQIVLMNYENLAWFCKEYRHAHDFDGIVFDEISKLKSVGGAGFKKLRFLLDDYKWRIGLTGTPVSESLEALFAYDILLTQGENLGRRKDAFMSEYFDAEGYMYKKYTPKPDAFERIAKKVQYLVHVLPDYTHTLPPLEIFYTYLPFDDDARAVYERMKSELLVDIKGTKVTAVNLAVKSLKLEQIAQGFLYDDGFAPIDVHRAKIKHAVHLLNALSEPVIIVYWFGEDRDALLDEIDCTLFEGDKGAIVDDWKAGKIKRLLIHPRSCGHGLDLAEGGRYMIFMSPIWSRDLWEQTIARLWRRGQQKTTYVTVIMMKDSIDDIKRLRCEGKADIGVKFLEHLNSL